MRRSARAFVPLSGCLVVCLFIFGRRYGHEAPHAQSYPSTYDVAHRKFMATERIYASLPMSAVTNITRSCTDCTNSKKHENMRMIIAHACTENCAELAALGLDGAQPPEHVHAMSRGVGYVTGGLYEADHILESIERAGLAIDFSNILDFGGSSGRVARMMAAAVNATVYVADPNTQAIEWVQRHIPRLRAFVSPQFPPLAFQEGMFDLVYAVSIWSHYAEALAIEWLNEMHRGLRPGGILAFTTHGLQSVRHYSLHQLIDSHTLETIQSKLRTTGHAFIPAFDALVGDWGVVNPKQQWGQAFFTVDWFIRIASHQFDLLYHGVGSEQGNQDMYVAIRK